MSLRDVTFVVEDGSLGNSGSTGTGVHVKIGASPVETTVPIHYREHETGADEGKAGAQPPGGRLH